MQRETLARFVAVLLAAVAAGPVDVQAAGRLVEGDLVHRSWTLEDGLPQSSVNDLVASSDGFLWVATFGGLARFDGTSFRRVDLATPDGRVRLRVTRVEEDRRGRLWIATEDTGVGYLEEERFVPVEAIGARFVTDLQVDAAGRIWVGFDTGGPAVVRADGTTVDRPLAGVFEGRINAFETTPDGALWIAGRGQLLRLGSDGGLARYGHEQGLPAGIQILSVSSSRRGGVWLATDGGGLLRFDGRVVERYTVTEGLDGPNQWSVLEDRSGVVWMGSFRGGVFRLRDGRPEVVVRADGHGSGPVRVLLEGPAGTLWIGTSLGGLHRLAPPLFEVLDRDSGDLPVDAVLAVTEDRDGVVWAGLNCGGIVGLVGGEVRYRRLQPETRPGDCVWSLLASRDGSLWVGTWGGGVGRLVDGRVERPLDAPGLAEGGVVVALFQDSTGAIWIGTRGEGAYRVLDGVPDRFDVAAGLPSDDVRCFAEDSAGRVWIGTTAGLARVAGGSVESLPEGLEWSGARVRALHPDGEGRLWVGTYGAGLGVVRGDQLRVIGTDGGLAESVVSAILEGVAGELWLSGNRGIYRLSVQELLAVADGRQGSIVPASFGTDHGLPTTETTGGFQPSAWRTRDGRLYFPTVRGLVSIRPASLERGAPPKALVEEVLVDGAAVPSSPGPLEIPAGHGRVEIRFSCLSLSSAGTVAFRYRLSGADSDWVTAGGRRFAVYHHLGAGRYRFEVQGLSAEGGWSEPAVVGLVVPRAVWRRPWFAVVALVLLLAAPAAAVRWRSVRRERRLREQASALRRLSVGIVHEFRQPLQVLEARLAILEQGAPGDLLGRSVGEAREAVARLRTLADRIEHLHGEGLPPEAPYAGGEMMVDLRRRDDP